MLDVSLTLLLATCCGLGACVAKTRRRARTTALATSDWMHYLKDSICDAQPSGDDGGGSDQPNHRGGPHGPIRARHMASAGAFAAALTVAGDATLWTGDPELLVDGSSWRRRDLRS